MITRLFLSERDPTRDPYVTTVDPTTGDASCSCPGWIYSKTDPKADCKHIKKAWWDAMRDPSSTVQDGSGRVEGSDRSGHRAEGRSSNVPEVCLKAGDYTSMKPKASRRSLKPEHYINDEGFWIEPRYRGERAMVRVMAGRKVGGITSRASLAVLKAFAALPAGVYDAVLLDGGRRAVVVDVVEIQNTPVIDLPLVERRQIVEISVAHYAGYVDENGDPVLRTSPTRAITDESIHEFVDRYEGAIIKRLQSRYLCGVRSNEWLLI